MGAGGRDDLRSDVFNTRGRINLELSPSLAKEKFNGGKVSFINLDVFFKLRSICTIGQHILGSQYDALQFFYLAKAWKCERAAYLVSILLALLLAS